MNAKKLVLALLCLGGGTFAMAAPIAYIPLGSANQVIAVDAENDKIIRSYSGVENPHGLVATPDGDYLVAGSLKETPVPESTPSNTPNSKQKKNQPKHNQDKTKNPETKKTHHEAVTPDGKYVISTHPT